MVNGGDKLKLDTIFSQFEKYLVYLNLLGYKHFFLLEVIQL